jgi:hypothetical protein
MRQRKPGEKQLRHAISFFEMGITRENKCLNSQFAILLNPARDCLWISDQGGAYATPHETNSSPQVRTYFEV